MDEESAILGLPGQRETTLKLDADHSQMCKVSGRGAMYRLISGNIRDIADQVLEAERGFVPQPSNSPNPGPPLPPRMHSNSSMPYAGPPRTPNPNEAQVIGTIYQPADRDPRSIQVAKYMNEWKWDDARRMQYSIFQEHLRTLGQDHHSTLLAGYYLANIELEAGCLAKGKEWADWVCNNSQRVLGKRHELAMKSESIAGEFLFRLGKAQEGESICSNVLARQQMQIGDDHLDTIETRRRVALAYAYLGQRTEAIQAITKYSESVKRLLGANHILYFASVLDTAEQAFYQRMANTEDHFLRRYTGSDPQGEAIEAIVRELSGRLGRHHPLTIRGLWISGAMQALDANGSSTSSETLRRALATAEEYLGPEHSETMNIVGAMGMMFAMRGSSNSYGYNPYLPDYGANLTAASPWLQRYLSWAERNHGLGSPDVQTVLSLLAKMHYSQQQYRQAEPYFERLFASYRAAEMPVPEELQTIYQICRMNNPRLLLQGISGGSGAGTDFAKILSSFRR